MPGDARSFRRLELTVRRRIEGRLHGDAEGQGLGGGTDPEELIPYQPGQDVRRIDWNVTARTGEAHLWLTRAQRELQTWILVDRTPSMAFGTTLTEKIDVAELVAAAVGLLTDAPGNRAAVGLIEDGGVRWHRPRPGRSAAVTMTRLPTAPRHGDRTITLAAALGDLARHARPRGMCVVVTDLLGDGLTTERPFDWEPALRHLAARHDVIVVEVVDPREQELPDTGDTVFVDPETGDQLEVSTSDPELRLSYATVAARFRDDTGAAVRAARADHLRIRTDDDWAAMLARFVRDRARRPARRAAHHAHRDVRRTP